MGNSRHAQVSVGNKGGDFWTLLTIDARMLFASGIGRYLREMLLRFPARDARLTILFSGNAQRSWLLSCFPNADFIQVNCGVYSIREQLIIPFLLSNNSVYWAPHYNFPVFSRAHHIVTVHDLAHLALPQFFGRGLKRVYSMLMLRAVVTRSRHVIYISNFTRCEFSRLIGRLPLGNSVIPNGVGGDWVAPISSGCGSYYLCVGNLKPHKNIRLLAKAIDGRKLVVVGKRDGFITSEMFNPDELTHNIVFTGEVSDAELINLYRGARALLFPSLYEGFGLPLLEAMACGCPVITSNAASIPEVCGAAYSPTTRTGNVIYFDPRSITSIQGALSSFEALSEIDRFSMQSNAQRYASRFSWDRAADSTWDLMAGVLRELVE